MIMSNNAKLYRYGMKNSNTCALCGQDEENDRHLFIECNKVNKFWIDVKHWTAPTQNININFTTIEIILATPYNVNPFFYLYITFAKMHISVCKFQMIEP